MLIKRVYKCKYKNVVGVQVGHKWYAKLNNVKNNNHWCPECANLKRSMSNNKTYTIKHWKTNKELICVASYEKKVVEYLNANKINFRWQPKTFRMPNKKTYRPDIYLFSTKKWIEIKGYFRHDSKLKWNWFHKTHTNSELWDEDKLKNMGIM